MKAEQQSICPPYAQKMKDDYEGEPNEGKKGNIRKRNETILAVARLLIQDCLIKRSDMADVCGVSPQEISSALKKLQKTVNDGHTIIGLNNAELELLINSLEKRRREEEAPTIKIAKLLIEDFLMDRSKIAAICGITPQKVSTNIKKVKTMMMREDPSALKQLDIERLKANIELREVYQKSLQDELLRNVARILLKNYRITGKEIAQELNIKEPNVSSAIKKIKIKIGYQETGAEEKLTEAPGIIGLTSEENAQLLRLIINREKEALREKELRQKEIALAKASRESMKDIVRQAKRKASKKPATISDIGLAEWNVMSYDAKSGKLDYGYIFKGWKEQIYSPSKDDKVKTIAPGLPRDFPKRLPKNEMSIQQDHKIDPSYLIPSKASGTVAGRKRINGMRLT
ncbi:hypothetical protein [Desulforamulus ruminis]|uniref:hypothetical protein n=1 Tax=Desulforamulus ruminis TaxID=1564 RepID=UPI00059D972A|nr:hypothetical protein [Desulforamulus ruminis]